MAKAYYWNDPIWNSRNAGASGWSMRIYNYRSSTAEITSTTGATLFPATFAAADAIYFGCLPFYGKTFRNIYFDIATAMAGTYTLAWEYHNGNAWTALTVTDNTANFTNLGVNSVDFTPPTDWQSLNPTPAIGNGYWIRCRVATCTVSTTNPVMTANVYIKFGNNTFAITGDTAGTDDITFDDIFNNAGAAPITRLTTDTTGRRAYRFDCHLEVDRRNVSGGTGSDKKGYLNDSNVDIHFGNECRFFCHNTSSAITLGKVLISSNTGYQGCTIRYNRTSYGTTYTDRLDDDLNGTVKLYDTKFVQLEDGTTPQINFRTQGLYVSNGSNTSSEYLDVTFENMNFVDLQGGTGVNKKRVNFYNISQPQLGGGGTIDDVKSVQGGCQFGLFLQSAVDLTITNLRASNHVSRTVSTYNFDNTCDVINPSWTRPTNSGSNLISWGFSDAGKIRERYTVDIHVQDEAGNAISSATVAMQPDSTAPVTTLEENNNFSVTTDASGNITQQTLTVAKFVSSAPTGSTTTSTISDYGPFIITVTKSGFKTMRLRKLSVLTASYGLKGVVLTVVLPRENINLAPNVIQLS